MVQSVELGRRMPQQSFIDAADDVLGAGGMLTAGATHLVRERVAVRLKRQEIWGRGRPSMASGVLEEAALRRIVGGPEVMKGQVLQLIELAQRRNIALQVMPTDGGTHPGISGPVTLVGSVDHRNLAYVEYQGGGILISEAEAVSVLAQRFGMIRVKALIPDESLRFLEGLGEEL